MENTIYVRLLGEGVQVYRPVLGTQISSDAYVLGCSGTYDREDEEWEFGPGASVVVVEKILEGRTVLVAIAAHPR